MIFLVVKSIAYPQPGGRGHPRKAWVELCRRGLQTLILFRKKKVISLPCLRHKTLFYNPVLYRFAYRIQQVYQLETWIEFSGKKNAGTTNVDRSSENHTCPVQLHIPGTRLGQIKECPSPPGIHKPRKRMCFHDCHALAIILALRFLFF